MGKLTATDTIHIRALGKDVRVTAVFTTGAEANAYLAAHADEGVIAEAGQMVWVADIHDLGRAPGA